MERNDSKNADEREREELTTPDTMPAPVDRHDQPSSVMSGTSTGSEDIDGGGNTG